MNTHAAGNNSYAEEYEVFPRLMPFETFEQTVGPLLHKCRNDVWSFRFVVETKHLNPLGKLHGGMIMTFVDHSFGGTAFHAVGNKPCITVSLHIDFVASAAMGDVVDGVAEVTRKTGNLVFVAGELLVAKKVIATASGVWRTVELK